MDFRSQLSNFQSGGGGSGSLSTSGGKGGNGGRGSSSSNNQRNNRDSSGNSSHRSGDDHDGRRERSRSPPPPSSSSRGYGGGGSYDRHRPESSSRDQYRERGRDRDRGSGRSSYDDRGNRDRERDRGRSGLGCGGRDDSHLREGRTLSSGYDRSASSSDRRKRSRSYDLSDRDRDRDNDKDRGPQSSRRRFYSPDRVGGSNSSSLINNGSNSGSSRDLDGLGDLRRYGYPVPRGFPSPPTPEELKRKTKHICLLALTIKDLPYEHIWKYWASSSGSRGSQDDYYISLVCHAKYPHQVKSQWLKQRMLTNPPQKGRGNSFLDPEYLTRTPDWGSVDITRAMIDLMETGLTIGQCTQTDPRFAASRFVVHQPPVSSGSEGSESTNKTPPVDHFLFVSETCLPVATVPEFLEKISSVAVSWVNARHRHEDGTPQNKYEDDQFAGIQRKIPGQYRWKADQWVLLARRHVAAILDVDRPPHMAVRHQLWQSFAQINASDEMYIPTSLALSGFLRLTRSGHDTQIVRGKVVTLKDEEKDDANTAGARTDVGKKADRLASPSTTTAAVKSSKPSTPGTQIETNPGIELRPVTYTDWSEGMRNPKTFANGVPDLKRVGSLARGLGCLVARKFAPFISVPGARRDAIKRTGDISVEEWETVMSELQEADAKRKTAELEKAGLEGKVADPTDANDATAGTTVKEDKDVASKDDGNNNDEREEGGESCLDGATPAPADGSQFLRYITRKNEYGEEDDDDEGENELE